MQSDRDAAMAWQFEQELCCPGCGAPRDVWWIYGDLEDPEVADRYRKLEEQARAEYDHRKCVRCGVKDSADAKESEQRRDNPARFYGLHPVFEPVTDGSAGS